MIELPTNATELYPLTKRRPGSVCMTGAESTTNQISRIIGVCRQMRLRQADDRYAAMNVVNSDCVFSLPLFIFVQGWSWIFVVVYSTPKTLYLWREASLWYYFLS